MPLSWLAFRGERAMHADTGRGNAGAPRCAGAAGQRQAWAGVHNPGGAAERGAGDAIPHGRSPL